MQDFNFKIERSIIDYDNKAKLSRLYMSLDPSLSHDGPLTSTQALNLWLSVYPEESISHMTTPVTYILNTYFYEVQRFPITTIHTFDSGGGCFVDLVYLQSGKVLSVNDECAILHASEQDFFEATGELAYMSFPSPSVVEYEFTIGLYETGQPAWIESVGYYHGLVELNMYFKQSIILNQDKFTVSMTEVL